MSPETETICPACPQLEQEFQHLRSEWCWLLLFGVLLVLCGTTVVVVPAMPIVTSFAAMIVLGVTLMVAGLATIVTSFWAGKWSGMMVQTLVGILYLVVGATIGHHPVAAALATTVFLATIFIVVGAFRAVAALMIRFPHWGWALLNGLVTFLLGVIIFRHFADVERIWLLGLLIGLEMLLHGWTWVMLSLAIRKIPAKAAP